jgi:hypothetical protein
MRQTLRDNFSNGRAPPLFCGEAAALLCNAVVVVDDDDDEDTSRAVRDVDTGIRRSGAKDVTSVASAARDSAMLTATMEVAFMFFIEQRSLRFYLRSAKGVGWCVGVNVCVCKWDNETNAPQEAIAIAPSASTKRECGHVEVWVISSCNFFDKHKMYEYASCKAEELIR